MSSSSTLTEQAPGQHVQQTGDDDDPLIALSPPLLLATTLPLFLIAALSYWLKLDLERSVIIGTLRTGLQLTICGYVLKPVFLYGGKPAWDDFGWLLVAVYLIIMILLASWEASNRSKYSFHNMFACILASFLINVGLVSILTFGFIIQPDPLWSPKYTIPIVGMLLGNCINGISLSLNSLLTDFKEKAAEVELLLSFGASIYESTMHLFRDAVRTGTMPMINGMNLIGIVSLPGMMTGQILGGSPVVEAARYQILITYLIATCAFGTILIELWFVRTFCCDLSRQRLCTCRLTLRTTANDRGIDRLPAKIAEYMQASVIYCLSLGKDSTRIVDVDEETAKVDLLTASDSTATTRSDYGTNSIQLVCMRRGRMHENGSSNVDRIQNKNVPTLELRRVSRSFQSETALSETFLFRDISLAISPGDVVAVSGPSGIGKSQLLRVIAGLSPLHNENYHGANSSSLESDLLLRGKSYRSFAVTPVDWRRRIRYVSQHKIEITGTPRVFVQRVASLASWRHVRNRSQGDNNNNNNGDDDAVCPSFDDMIQRVARFVDSWGMDASSCLDQEWKTLSGGESQRVYVAICLASKPEVLLMDESTSSLDSVSKQQLEQSVLSVAATEGVGVLWITHDAEQIKRMSS